MFALTNATSFEAPDDYRLGAGDKISIVIWGNSEMSAEYTLDKEGSIYPKLVGKVNLKGKTYGRTKNGQGKFLYKCIKYYPVWSKKIAFQWVWSSLLKT